MRMFDGSSFVHCVHFVSLKWVFRFNYFYFLLFEVAFWDSYAQYLTNNCFISIRLINFLHPLQLIDINFFKIHPNNILDLHGDIWYEFRKYTTFSILTCELSLQRNSFLTHCGILFIVMTVLCNERCKMTQGVTLWVNFPVN